MNRQIHCCGFACASAFLLLLTAATGSSQVPSPLAFRGKTITLRDSFRLPAGNHDGESGALLIDGGKDRRCSLEIAPGTVIEDLKLHVRSGAELIVRRALLRRCQIYAEPKSSVTIEDSGLDHCELSGFGDSRSGYPSIKLVGSVLAEPACLRPVNLLGVDMQDCLVIDQKVPYRGFRAGQTTGMTFAELARRPQIRYTTFTNCYVHADLFFTVSHCTFDNCPIQTAAAAAAPPSTGSEVMLPIRWVAEMPAGLPMVRAGVRLQPLREAIPGGCKVEHEWDGKILTMADATPASATTALQSVLPNQTAAVAGAATGSESPDGSARAQVKLQQTFINGLLVMPLPSGKEAGQVSKMNLTSLPGGANLRFSQPVGTDMESALREVQKFMRLRHNELPQDHDMEIAFEEKYSGKDGPSAAVACGLLVESAVTGRHWDPAFAVTGDLNADGSVQPIGGVAAKLRGATNGACKIVAIPFKNESAAADILIRDGPEPLVNITVFTLRTFDEAVALAAAPRTGELQEALAEMEVISSALKRDPRMMTSILRTPQAAARLQSVLAKAPNCTSAKYLLLYAQGRIPAKLSLGGSIEAADSDAQALVVAVNRDFSNATRTLHPDELGGNINRLRNLRPILDQRVWPYVDALVDFGEIIRGVLLNPVKTGARAVDFQQRARQAASSVVNAKQRLFADPTIREELSL